ncbi:hypothetical protein ACFQZS_01455 [Mucilaginibacter calamicampi]|uniref:Carbohydrate metabolism domain-containing protein n=1 Tax=Mucilaginibacter calamicampi TaxID=1302352 RepID=A0ABW2YTP3_9SPHI
MKKLQLLLLSALAFVNANAQKLPTVQQAGMRAPAGVTIDGKATDWGEMKAYNEAAEINYTVANDDKKLYLVVQTDVKDVYNRICNGGVKFVVQKNGLKTDEGAAFVKYPLIEDWHIFAFGFNDQLYRVSKVEGKIQLDAIPVPEVISEEQADSTMQHHNKMLQEKLKFIYSHGLPAIGNLVPVSNDKGLEAAVAFDSKKVYTCEMAIDMKLLGLSARAGEKFAYHIVINGEPYKYSFPVASVINQHTATTDFWGEYTLIK